MEDISPLRRPIVSYSGLSCLSPNYGTFSQARPGLSSLASVLNPVLVSGVSRREDSTVSTSEHNVSYPFGTSRWLDGPSNMEDHGTRSSDVSGTLAALFSMSGQRAPTAPLRDGDPNCSIRATTFSLRASCKTQEHDNRGYWNIGMPGEHHTCSTVNPYVCVSFINVGFGSQQLTYANFSTGPPLLYYDQVDGSCPGAWCTIYGASIPYPGGGIESTLWTVDCEVQFGTAEIVQTGGGTPEYVSGSFKKSTNLVTDEPEMVNWNRIYTEHQRSPYTFSASIENGSDTLFKSLVAYTLLEERRPNQGRYLSNHFEGAFEMATMMAWTRSPIASPHTYTRTNITTVYVFNQRVLLILLVPFLAAILSLRGRWMAGRSEDVLAFDSIEVVKRGPVVGLEHSTWQERHRQEICEVFGWSDDGPGPGEGTRLIGGQKPAATSTGKWTTGSGNKGTTKH